MLAQINVGGRDSSVLSPMCVDWSYPCLSGTISVTGLYEHGPPLSNIKFRIRVLIADQIAFIIQNAMINGDDLTNDLRTLD